MSCMQGESGRETLCSQTSRNWKRWTHLKLMQKDSTRRKWLRPKLVISICDWEKSKTTWRRSGSENIHLDKGQRRTRRSAWKPSRRVRRVSSTNTTRLNARWRWSPKWFLVEHGELHLPSSCWTQSQTPCVERRDSPNSTAISWRFEGYKYGLGCIAGTSCWRLLEHWWGPRKLSDARSGFTWITLLDERPPDEYTWSGRRLTKRRATSMSDHLCPEMWTNMSDAAQQWEKQKWVIEKPKLDNVWKLRGLYFVDPEDTEFKETLKNARKLEIPIEAVVPCKIRKSQHRETCCYTDNRKSKTCMHRGSRRIHKKAFGRNPA